MLSHRGDTRPAWPEPAEGTDSDRAQQELLLPPKPTASAALNGDGLSRHSSRSTSLPLHHSSSVPVSSAQTATRCRSVARLLLCVLAVCALVYVGLYGVSSTVWSETCCNMCSLHPYSLTSAALALSLPCSSSSPLSSTSDLLLASSTSPSSHAFQRVYHQCPVAFGGRSLVTVLSHVPVYLFVHQVTWRSTAITPTIELQIGLYSTVTGNTLSLTTPQLLSIFQQHNISVTYHYNYQDNNQKAGTVNVSSECYPSSYRDIHFIHCPLADHPPDSLSLHLYHPPTTSTYTHHTSICTYVVPHATLGICGRPLLDTAPDLVLQWMRYHLYIGVDIIFLYDSKGRMHDHPEVAQLIAEGRVRYYYLPIPKELSRGRGAVLWQQIPTYNGCREEMRQFARWVTHNDPDEYWRLMGDEYQPPFERRCVAGVCDSMMGRYLAAVERYDPELVYVTAEELVFPDPRPDNLTCLVAGYTRRCPGTKRSSRKSISHTHGSQYTNQHSPMDGKWYHIGQDNIDALAYTVSAMRYPPDHLAINHYVHLNVQRYSYDKVNDSDPYTLNCHEEDVVRDDALVNLFAGAGDTLMRNGCEAVDIDSTAIPVH